MGRFICSKCMKVFDIPEHGKCPHCHSGPPHVYDFKNSDEFLKEKIPQVLEERKKTGLEGLVGGLQCVIINTEPGRHQDAVDELLRFTGLELDQAFQDSDFRTCVLRTPNSADFLVRSRIRGENPFTAFNLFPKSKHLPNTRLETFVFETEDLEKYFVMADLFVLPGTGGLAVQEAMVYGLPVVVAEGDGTQEDLVRSENGWLIPANDENALSSALEEALIDPVRLRKMGAASFKIVQNEINIEQMVNVFVEAINSTSYSPDSN